MISVDVNLATKWHSAAAFQRWDQGEKFLFGCGAILLAGCESLGPVHHRSVVLHDAGAKLTVGRVRDDCERLVKIGARIETVQC